MPNSWKNWTVDRRPDLQPKAHPTLLDIAWAAGVFEGEGSCYRRHGYSVHVVQKDRWLCDRLKLLFGGKVSIRHNAHGAYYFWLLTGTRARGFMMTIYKFMSPRRKAQLYETFHPTLKGTVNQYKYATHCKHGHEFTEENTCTLKDGERMCRACNRERYRRRREAMGFKLVSNQ